tara:strand:+ start:117 stop:626 length:510 start_codon:yes stop_codon:yes gene_type:complete
VAKKVKKDFDFQKLGRRLPGIVTFLLNQVGNRINLEIQNGIDKNKDLDGQPFEKLSPLTTKRIRALKGQGSQPLKISRNMAQTKKKPATEGSYKFVIAMNAGRGKNKSKVQYGAFHNQGFTNSPKSAFPNTRVPQRQWFGIPKSMQAGGKSFDKYLELFKTRIITALKK